MHNHGHLYVKDNFNELYHEMLRDVYKTPGYEIIGLSYVLTNPVERNVINSVRAFEPENAEKFFRWVLSGQKNLDDLKAVTKRAEMYDREVEGRCPHYGPRILPQLTNMIDELHENSNSRRACILILDAGDQIFLPEKRNNRNTIEYPCTVALTYFIRGGYLHAHTMMRSNNMCSTICYDNWNFTRMHETVLDLCNERHMRLGLGHYFHYITNAHLIPGEVKRTGKILKEHFGE